MSDTRSWNDQVIDEFRANEGRVGGPFEGAPLLLLHHIGAKSGTERVTPMMYQAVGDDLAVFASYAGMDVHPAWYHNLLANPDVTAEVGTETVALRARDLPADERAPIWEKQKADYPGFAGYEQKTSRTIPVVLLERR
ncbi:nitroreductase family deazaflavin-dependent oxidoreductase [Actinomycetospora chibensis]|uniref:Nitroreductase family deazaflavin-dependent oxidoreductase n=1 Tax=Actinomycetospora chibensis TaxID=663606 RepID=A0ABV9RCH4_9PSEU|nr:nitroreductase family deazaflavin-dependent oxidoreductase [Actinomycetospora chibensis]MDD7924237.1 nitroreductase family deazaflavin-dependent oxidoreductase [Actinomycetospora chibensis]